MTSNNDIISCQKHPSIDLPVELLKERKITEKTCQ